MSLSTYSYIIKCVRAVILHTDVPEKPDDISWKEVFLLSKEHGIAQLVFDAMHAVNTVPPSNAKADTDIDAEALQAWKHHLDANLLQDMQQRAELASLSKELKKRSIPHVLLKGSILKQFYPKTYYRTMCDIDMYVPPEALTAAGELLLSRGSRAIMCGGAHHDEYEKPPYLSVELHWAASVDWYTEINAYFANAFASAAKTNNQLPLTDCYLYHLSHALKHYQEGGIGIRTVLDHYFIRQKLSKELDLKALTPQITALGLAELDALLTEFSERWFCGDLSDMFDTEHPDELKLILSSGTYGVFENMLNVQMKSKSKLQLLKERILVPNSILYCHYPYLKEKPYLRPYCLCHRVLRFALGNKGKLIATLKKFCE